MLRPAFAVVLVCVRSVRACVRGVGVRAYVRLPPARVVCCVGVSCLRALCLLPALVGVGGRLRVGWVVCLRPPAAVPGLGVFGRLAGWLVWLVGSGGWVLCR